MNISFTRVLSVATVITWLIFFLLDRVWTQTLMEAVARGTYGETFGPVSYVRPIFLYLTAGLSTCCAVLLLVGPRRRPF